MVTHATEPWQETSEVSVVALSRLFSSKVFRELGSHGCSRTATGVIREASFAPLEHQNLAELFEKAFQILVRTLRSEYVFKNAIAERILLGKHNLRTATMLTEFRAGKNKADAVILNGTSTVYEIKSGRDKLDRLKGQLKSYLSIFNRVVVVADECHRKELLEILPANVGLQILSPRYQFTTVREASSDLERLDPVQMFDSLQRDEFLGILAKVSGWDNTGIPNGLLHSLARTEFAKLSPNIAHDHFVSSLRKRADQQKKRSFIERVPSALKAMAVTFPFNISEQERILEALNNPAKLALAK